MLTTISYKGWDTCYKLANDRVELVVTGDVGPRVIHFGFVDGDNAFYEDPALLGKVGGDTWVNYGGHRLWHAPEVQPRTYMPDNGPITMTEHATFVRFVQPVEPATGIQKELDVALDPGEARATVTHRLRNTNLWAVELAPWAISVMAEGGTAILPFPPRGPHTENLLPSHSFTLWAYTDMQDPRWTWGTRFALLRQDPGNAHPQKAGLWAPDGWAAYANHGELFVKAVTPQPGMAYPDLGCNVEAFTDAVMLEVETLGPLTRLAPGATVEHVERWHLFEDVPAPQDDADVEAHVLPKIEALLP
jgi:hypothetical protein